MQNDAPREPRILQRPEHTVSRKDITENAVKVLYRLHRAGFKGYLVGGGVRDLMLGGKPKDFDIATDARPNAVRRLFRNSRIIGRRFRLVHVFFHDEIVEVTTFRRDPDPDAQRSAPGELLITDDNVFGTPREDAFRRDFTINALFYDIGDFSVIDWVGGVDDLQNRLVRVIGDPDTRYLEDPVRMMRACEMAGRLDFEIEAESLAGIERCRREIEKGAPARVTEEVLQLMRCGSAAPSMRWMERVGLLQYVLPELSAILSEGGEREGVPLSQLAGVLPAVDRMVGEGRTPPDAVLLGAILLPKILVERQVREADAGKRMSRHALGRLADEVMEPFFRRFTLPKARAEEVSQAIRAFHRLAESRWNDVERARFASRPVFDDALGLLEILVEATGEGNEVLEVWKKVPRPRRRHRADEPATQRRRRPRRRQGGGRGGRGGRRRPR